jgi:uncharacterized protein YjhX (UPF0386 family)
MAASNVRLFVKCKGTPNECARIIAEPAQMDEQGRFILKRRGVWRLYAIYNDTKVQANLIWQRDTWKLLGIHRDVFEVTPKGKALLVSTHGQPLGCCRILDIHRAWLDSQRRFIINESGDWEISRIENYKVYCTRLYVRPDGSWEFVDTPEGFEVLTE